MDLDDAGMIKFGYVLGLLQKTRPELRHRLGIVLSAVREMARVVAPAEIFRKEFLERHHSPEQQILGQICYTETALPEHPDYPILSALEL